VADPLPLAGLTVSHEALLDAVHAAAGVVVREAVPLPAVALTVADAADKVAVAAA
jgi:hypothetical protein